MLQKIKATADYIKNKSGFKGRVAVILGSGLGDFASEIKTKHVFPYQEIPNFPVSTVEGHSNRLIIGTYHNKEILAMQGRFHYYEGHTMETLTFPVRVFKMLGIEYLILSNAAGGINYGFEVGDLMMITDHINFFGTNPLIGSNIDELGPRFPDMTVPYDPELIQFARELARDRFIPLHEGVYIGGTGPSFETKAEYRFFHMIGGDAIGMSTVPEVIVANHMGMKVFAISVITNNGLVVSENGNSHNEVLDVATQAAPKLEVIFGELIKHIG
jgi:purine-nucleoside phosphorylase